MRILIIKISSLGDIIHTIPALTDAANNIDDISFDWVIEENFAEIPKMHPSVNRVIPVAIRRWRKSLLKTLFKTRELKNFINNLRLYDYDYVIDAQGLLKSAIISRLSKGLRIGLNKKSLTEPLARFFYQKTVDVDLKAHAIFRMRSIFAKALNYEIPDKTTPQNLRFCGDLRCFDLGVLNSSIDKRGFAPFETPYKVSAASRRVKNYIVFLHGTTWSSKHWIDEYWIKLAKIAGDHGYKIRIPYSNEMEFMRAKKIEKSFCNVSIIPKSNLLKIASIIKGAKAVVSVDTGLGHLATALDIPTISLYGPTNPNRIGTKNYIISNCDCKFCDKKKCKYKKFSSKCMESINPQIVWEKIISN